MKINKNFHSLMHNNFHEDDINALIKFVNKNKKNPFFTQGTKVKEFEEKWSKWLGVKYSVFVNSGTSANHISLKILLQVH